MYSRAGRRVLRGGAHTGVLIRADLTAISESIPRCKPGGVGREGAKYGVLNLRRRSRGFKN